ncbi:MAG TPA: hypothetical protein VN370_12095 [Desulfitobacteriaceae bacterium]|nr:hypothetical protein [Desulfitobacteriaceae bacterium]
MNYKVIYFTRTGNSRRVAEKIADKLSLQAIEITDNMSWQGISGFIRGGYYASRNKDVEIKIPDNLDGSEELIVVTPLWAGKAAPAVSTLLKTKALEKVHLVVTSGGTIIKDRSGYKSVWDIVKKNNDEDVVISDFVNTLV